MNILPNQLTSQGFELLDQLTHQDLIPFLQQNLKKSTPFRNLYYFINLILFGAAGFMLAYGYGDAEYSFLLNFSEFSLGIVSTLLLVPLHEYIHVVAYKSQSAINTSYDMNLKKFYFMALAHEFVANKKEFFVVAMAPVVVISVLMISLLMLLGPEWTLFILGMLVSHTAMSSGDFGIMNYFFVHNDKEIVTYDDVVEGKSYFYGKKVLD